MNSTDYIVLKTALAWLREGKRIAIATVVQTWGSSPRPVGSWLAIREDGQVVGSVSGGCVEDDLIRRVQTEILTRNTPELIVYGVSKEEAARFGLPCGGTLRLLVEPRPEQAVLEEILRGLKAIKLFYVVLIFIPVNLRFTQDLEKMVSPSGILKCKPPMVRAGACS